MTDTSLTERLFPGMPPARLLAELDTTHLRHGDLERLPELDFLRARGGVEGWLRLVAERGRDQFTVKNVDWSHPAAKVPERGFLSFKADVDMALQFLQRGATVTAEYIDREIEEFHPLLRRLARELGHPVGEGSYRMDMLAGPPGICTEMHTDADYAINLQIFGGKRWRLMPNNLSHPPSGCNDEETPVELLQVSADASIPTRIDAQAQSFETRPGSAVWRPTGIWHETENLGEELNLSIVFTLYGKGRYFDFGSRLIDFLHRRPEWRAPIFGVVGDPERQARYRQRVAQLLRETFDPAQGVTAADAYYNLPPALGSRYRFRPVADVQLRRRQEHAVHLMEVETADTIGELELKGDVETLAALIIWMIAQRDGFSGADAVGHAEISEAGPGIHADDVAQIIAGLRAIGAVVREEVGPSA